MGAYGLQTHIWNNNFKSILLLAGFPVLLLLLMYGLNVGYVAIAYDFSDVNEGLRLAFENMIRTWPFAFLGAGVRFAVAWMAHQAFYLEQELAERRAGPEPYLHVWTRKGTDRRGRAIVVCRRCDLRWSGVGMHQAECEGWETRYRRFQARREFADAAVGVG